MSSKNSEIVKLVTGGGVGDALCGLTPQFAVYNNKKTPFLYACVRDEVFKPLSFLFEGINTIKQLEESDFDNFLANDRFLLSKVEAGEKDEVYLNIPDILYKHPRAFDYKKYNTTPELLKTTRVLTNKWQPENIISLFLLSNTTGYSYFDIGGLAKELGKLLPNFQIYLPILTKWANKPIPSIKIPEGCPSNVYIDENPDFIENIKIAYKSYYAIVGDNALSHITYHLGCRRLVLDSRFPTNRSSIPWVSRWHENINDHISIDNFARDIGQLVKTNVEIEQTNLLPKNYVLNNRHSDWNRDLIIKY